MLSRIYMCWMLLEPVSPGAQKALQTGKKLFAILILTSKKQSCNSLGLLA
jgi:hypothetical protein